MGSLANILGKGENAGNKHTSIFSYSPKCFLPLQKQISMYELHLFSHLALMRFNLNSTLKKEHHVQVPTIGCKDPIFGENFNPLPDDRILNWSKLKQIADHILKCI